MLNFLVHKIFTLYINGVLNCKCPLQGQKVNHYKMQHHIYPKRRTMLHSDILEKRALLLSLGWLNTFGLMLNQSSQPEHGETTFLRNIGTFNHWTAEKPNRIPSSIEQS